MSELKQFKAMLDNAAIEYEEDHARYDTILTIGNKRGSVLRFSFSGGIHGSEDNENLGFLHEVY